MKLTKKEKNEIYYALHTKLELVERGAYRAACLSEDAVKQEDAFQKKRENEIRVIIRKIGYNGENL